MKTLTQFKKEMKEYFNTCVDREEGETFKDWFECLINALEEDGCIIKKGNRTYITD